MRNRNGERGQVLVIAALMMTSLMGFLALVIDVGNAYAQRRLVQNAADAAALAGAQYMVANHAGTISDAGVMGSMSSYLSRNGNATLGAASGPASGAWYVNLSGSTVSAVGAGGGAPSSAAGVRVNATKSVDTFFARILGYPTVQVTATGSAAYSAATTIPLNWTISGTPIMPIAFGLDSYTKCLNGFGPMHFSQPVDWASECTVDDYAHFGFTTLNIGNDCSNNTTKGVLDAIVYNPQSLGTMSVSVGTPIQVCSGTKDTTWNYVMAIGRTFMVPIISQADAAACNSNCTARIIRFVYMRAEALEGNGANTRIRGHWVDPSTMPPIKGTTLSSTPGSPTTAVTSAILFR